MGGLSKLDFQKSASEALTALKIDLKNKSDQMPIAKLNTRALLKLAIVTSGVMKEVEEQTDSLTGGMETTATASAAVVTMASLSRGSGHLE